MPSPLDPIPAPVLYNLWKHHANWVAARLSAIEPGDLPGLAAELVVVGTRLMDLYAGDLTAAGVAAWAFEALEADGVLAPDSFATWLDAGGGYRLLTHPIDGSAWTIRLGEVGGRYVHLHPGRHAPHTLRVNAATLKTAALALASAKLDGADSPDLATVNRVRREFLELPRLASLDGSSALLRALAAIRGTGSAGSPSRSSARA